MRCATVMHTFGKISPFSWGWKRGVNYDVTCGVAALLHVVIVVERGSRDWRRSSLMRTEISDAVFIPEAPSEI